MWTSKHPTLGRFWLVVDVPRGPVMGCHVAPCGWFVVLYKIVWFHRGSNPRPILRATDWQDRATLVLITNTIKNIFELKLRFRRRRKGPGLSPSPRFNKQCHMTTTAGVYAIGASPRIPGRSHTTRAIPTKRARG